MNVLAVVVFAVFVLIVLGLSFFFARRARSSSGYYTAGGSIHWSVNGISFAGDYLSAASFLGICGMIATVGYDGFLYSIGYLAGWIVALFVVAEPLKRLGKFTFSDALDAKFGSRGIRLIAALSTLIVSVFYLIPQMVGAGTLVTPLLGLPHYAGVIMVGLIVITIVATAGMTSTTYVQFIKGSLLIVFSLVLVIAVCVRGLSTKPDQGGKVPFHENKTLSGTQVGDSLSLNDGSYAVKGRFSVKLSSAKSLEFAKLENDTGAESFWLVEHGKTEPEVLLRETQWSIVKKDGSAFVNGAPSSAENQIRLVGNLESIEGKIGDTAKTGPINPFKFLAKLSDMNTKIQRWGEAKFSDGSDKVTVYYPIITSGNTIMRPGLKFKVEGSIAQRLDFISLMLALFLGTAALPHILIRYYTVPSAAAARKSTIVAIIAIGTFYVLTLFMGLGAMVNGVVNPLDNNMSAPLLARSFGTLLFAVISAIAFATVLGTVSGLIVAASGAVAHDIMDMFAGIKLTDKQKVNAGKIAAFGVGIIAIVLGILFKGMNVSFLVGWAFAVAASANLPAIVMILFWKKTNSKGVMVSIIVGIVVSIFIILLSPDMYALYKLNPQSAPIQINQPAIISVPLSFIALIVVSLATAKKGVEAKA